MGLRVRHNGVITDISGSDYEPGNLGVKRLKIRTGTGIKEYGLTTDPNATSYCGLNFRISGQRYYIGKRLTSTVTGNATRQGNATRSASSTRSSQYSTGSYQYTYTYTSSRTQSSVSSITTEYIYEERGTQTRGQVSVTITRTSQRSTYGWSGQSWVRGSGQQFWSREYASTNNIQTGGNSVYETAWYSVTNTSPAYTLALSTRMYSTTGAWQTETGSFTGGRTSARWRYVTRHTYSTSREYTSALTTAAYGTLNSYWGVYTYPLNITWHETKTRYVRPSGSSALNSQTHVPSATTVNISNSSGINPSVATHVYSIYYTFLGYPTRNVTRTLTQTLTSDQYVSRSWVSYTSSRQEDYTYASNYTYQSNYSTSSSRTTHNFV